MQLTYNTVFILVICIYIYVGYNYKHATEIWYLVYRVCQSSHTDSNPRNYQILALLLSSQCISLYLDKLG